MRSEKLLVYLKPKFLGDAVMAAPLLRALAGSFDKPTVLASTHIQEMLREDRQGLQMVVPGVSRGLPGVLAESARLRKMKFDMAILVNRSFRSALVAAAAGIPQRVGHATEHRAFLLTKTVRYDKQRFEAAGYGDLASAVDVEGEFDRVSLTITDAEREEGLRMIGEATVGVQPGASFAAKTLPLEGLAKVVNRLGDGGHRVAMIGGKEERHLGAALQGLAKEPLLNLIGVCTLRQSMGAVAGLRACVGGSTGIMHIAAAVGCPTITVFGPTSASRWGHNYAPHQSVSVASRNIADMDPDVVYEAVVRALQQHTS